MLQQSATCLQPPLAQIAFFSNSKKHEQTQNASEKRITFDPESKALITLKIIAENFLNHVALSSRNVSAALALTTFQNGHQRPTKTTTTTATNDNKSGTNAIISGISIALTKLFFNLFKNKISLQNSFMTKATMLSNVYDNENPLNNKHNNNNNNNNNNASKNMNMDIQSGPRKSTSRRAKCENLDFNSRRRRGRLRFGFITRSALHAQSVLGDVASFLLTLLFSFVVDTYVNMKTLVLSSVKCKSYLKITSKMAIHSNCNQNNNKSNSKNYYSLYATSATTTYKFSLSMSYPSLSTLLYALLLLTTILILPCTNHIAAAAKPKSATQLQQQKQHHHQELEQKPPNLAYAAGADNIQIDSGGMLLTSPSYQIVSSQTSNEEESEFLYPSSQFDEFDEEKLAENDMEVDEEQANVYKDENQTRHDNETVIKTPLFPKDLFTKEQLENGAVVCHILGVIYMFVALAIVCDEFFVPSLDVIIEKLGITDDVAGATFMAAGGSAPELFTSVIGVFVSFDDVGIGTIVGSAVFNILFVIGMCALFSRTILSLTWWPLFRDCSFYSLSLMVLIYFFRDNLIYWWEALILFCVYIAYVTFMKWNVEVESCVKKLISKNKVTRVRSTDQLMPAGNAANSSETSMATQPGGSVTSRAASETRSGPPGSSSGVAGATGNSSGGNTSSTQTGAKFRHGLLQLMIHTIDPLHDGKVDEKATQLHAIASLKVLLDATKPQRGGATTSAANHVKINLKETTLADRPNGNIDTTLDSPSLSGRRPSWIDQRVKIQTRKFSIKQPQEIEDEPEPLSMAWPDTARKRLTYILVAPLLIPMWLTLPDTRTPKGKKLFPVTFIGSILWIAAFSYLMVWWANVAGDTARIPPEVMGLTFLAAGTSIPDLITSVIVARKGFGDMAVSSSVGSNIFDVTVGLPIPWLLYGIFYGAPVEVNSVGMVCSITILFMMLIFVVMSIACFHWRMNKGLGFTMFLLYFVFVAVSLMFEYDVITCPV
ncbi:solute carrier family 24 member Nckx30C isoform 3-T7 [Glossina fuscipes fuscipes]